MLGAYAIGSIGISDPAIAAYRSTLGGPTVTARATNTIVFKPEIGVWYDVNKKVYVNVNADQFILRVGVAYSIF